MPSASIVPYPQSDELAELVTHLHGEKEECSIAVARMLHDDMGALLVAAAMDLEWVHEVSTDAPTRCRLNRARAALGTAIDLKRCMTEKLRPSLLDNFGLFAACRWHLKHVCQRGDADCSETYPESELALRPEALTGLFRIMQESLSAIFSEPMLKSVDVQVTVEDEVLVLSIEHRHHDVEPVDLTDHDSNELRSATHRVLGLGGQLTVDHLANGSRLRAAFKRRELVEA
ncbi:MAG: histidine kinase [Pseudomonadota bacterium]|nr:histidine kinase [Pseudomonadota bacterium]